MITLYNRETFDEIDWNSIKDGQYIRAYFEPLINDDIKKYIKNVNTELFLLKVNQYILPISKNDKQFDNSYVCSFYTHYVSYAKEELWELNNKPLEKIFSKVIDVIGWMLRKSTINKVVIVNNWLISTNLYEQLTKQELQAITEFLTSSFPDYTICFRSINRTLHHEMMASLEQLQYEKMMSRSIYLFTMEDLKSKHYKEIRKDGKLIDKNGLAVTDGRQDITETASIIYQLYTELYIKKYSVHNPQFTKAFFEHAIRNQLFTFKFVRTEEEVGVIGYFVRNSVLTTPILGYRVELGKKFGLYRILSFLITKEIINHHYFGHRSAGASRFKRKRGAVQEMEYTFYYNKHLKTRKRMVWKTISWIMNKIVEPMAIRKQF